MAAGDFTNIRVESTSRDTVTIRYSYAGAAGIKLYRAVSGGSFSAIIVIGTDYGSYPSPLIDADTALLPATVYEYKFSDDDGSTFTSAFTVKTHAAFPVGKKHSKKALPPFSADDDVNAENLDIMRTEIEAALNNDVNKPQEPCFICPTNGSVVLDCSEGCERFIIREEDITDLNSISINCESLTIEFQIPEGTETEICGFPRETGFSGDECFEAPVSSFMELPRMSLTVPSPCPHLLTPILGSEPCQGDYVRECWSGGLFRNNTKHSLSFLQCDCSPSSDGYKTDLDSSYTWTMVSGEQPPDTHSSLEFKGYSGLSIYYRQINSNCTPSISRRIQSDWGDTVDDADALSYSITGKPIFGFATDVPEGATIKNFSGYVVLFDYPNSRFIYGLYTNGNLQDGEYPSIIESWSMSSITTPIVQVTLRLRDSGALADAVLYYDGGDNNLANAHTNLTPQAGTVGSGIIWVANTTPLARHSVTLTVPIEKFELTTSS